MVIYKYPIYNSGDIISAPFVKLLDIQYQDGIPMLWAVVDPDRVQDTEVCFNVLGTGWEFEGSPGTYIKTLQDDYGFVWHFFIVSRSQTLVHSFGKAPQAAVMA